MHSVDGKWMVCYAGSSRLSQFGDKIDKTITIDAPPSSRLKILIIEVYQYEYVTFRPTPGMTT